MAKNKKPAATADRLRKIEKHILQLEKMLQDAISSWQHLAEKRTETPVRPWRFLVRRQHPWRRQLYIKGRNMTARQLVGSMKANRMDEKTAAENYHLPLEAIQEALRYVERNLALLVAETEIEKLMHQREGNAQVNLSMASFTV